MPRVPTLDNFHTGISTAVPSLSGPNAGEIQGRQAMQAGQAMAQAGDALSRVMLDAVDQQNQVRVNDAMNQAIAARLKLTHDKDAGFTTLQGKAALERPDGKPLDQEYSEKYKATLSELSAGLGNDAQRRAFQMQSSKVLTEFTGQLQQHMTKEAQQFAISTQAGTVKVAVDQMALDWQSPDAVAQGQKAIKAAVAEAGRLQGLAPAEVLAKTVDALSVGHQAVIGQALQAGKVDYAKEYMKAVNAELTPQARLQLGEAVKQTDVAVQATRKADEIWTAAGPGQDRNAPIDLFKMEAAARSAYADDPSKAKATIAELRERAAAFNASQSEYHAANTASVYRMLDAGKGIGAVKRSPEWLALPGDQQHRITLSLEQEAAARESRAAASEARDFTRIQRNQHMLLLNNGAAYMRYGDPAVLGSMTRTQVEALRPTFGQEGTMHLLSKFDTLQTREGKMVAAMDQDAFNTVAEQMGLKPFAKDGSEDHKRNLGTLKYRIEELIDQAQGAKKAPLDRQEKMELMRQEMARTVAVPTWFGMSSDSVPVIQLNKGQAGIVKVPAADREQIVQALKIMSAQQPNNPAFAPTDENVRRLYLRKTSPAGRLIP
jgi:hypothetical protein